MHYRHIANTQKMSSHNELKQFMNSVGNVQICRDVHSSTLYSTRSLCAPLPDFCFRDSCNSHHWTCVSPSSLPNSRDSTRSGPILGVLCTAISSTLKHLPSSVLLPVLISLLFAQAISHSCCRHVKLCQTAGQK